MSIKRNTLYNIGGALAPLALTLLTVPLYLHRIGEARYGVLALVWLLLGYFGLFDLGLSTATTNALARRRAEKNADLSSIFLTSLLTNALLGILIGSLALALAPLVLERTGSITPALKTELMAVLPWLAAAVPLVTVGGVLTGVLTAHERFGTTNLIGLIGTALFQLAPLLAAYAIGGDLPSVIPVAIAARAVPVALTALAALRLLPLRGARWDRAILSALLSYGGWVMVTNLIGPILVSIDQFVIAGLLGAGAVAYYSVGYSLAVRLQILPSALMQTMFPRLSQQSGPQAQALAARAFRVVLLVMTTLSVPAIIMAQPFIALWISPAFAAQSGPVTRILLISMWVNGLAFIPYALLQAQGRPWVIARYHLMEVVPFLVLLWAGIAYLGLVGAALAWAARTIADAILLLRAARLPMATYRPLPVAALALTGAALLATLPIGPLLSAVLAATAGLALAGWSITAEPTLRDALSGLFVRLRGRR